MHANPGKIKSIILGKKGLSDCKSFTMQNNTVEGEGLVKLLAVTFDCVLNDDMHILDI